MGGSFHLLFLWMMKHSNRMKPTQHTMDMQHLSDYLQNSECRNRDPSKKSAQQ
jgi:hypothetical protein